MGDPKAGADTTFVAVRGGPLAVCEFGQTDGSPLFVLHGCPGSRYLRQVGGEYERQAIRAVTYDRPGYGSSPRVPGRRMVDSAHHVVAIADALGIDQFAVLGLSAGGGHALAVAAVHPKRVTRCATIGALGSAQVEDLDFFADMPADQRKVLERVTRDGEAYLVRDEYPRLMEFVRSFPSADIPEPDRSMLVETLTEAVRSGPWGFVDDHLTMMAPWGFELSDVICPTRVMLGEDDPTVPRRHGEWMVSHMPSAELVLAPGGHIGTSRAAEEEELLAWLVRPR